eukprot:358899-Chlamydomonas_euryale.AAC.1
MFFPPTHEGYFSTAETPDGVPVALGVAPTCCSNTGLCCCNSSGPAVRGCFDHCLRQHLNPCHQQAVRHLPCRLPIPWLAPAGYTLHWVTPSPAGGNGQTPPLPPANPLAGPG